MPVRKDGIQLWNETETPKFCPGKQNHTLNDKEGSYHNPETSQHHMLNQTDLSSFHVLFYFFNI